MKEVVEMEMKMAILLKKNPRYYCAYNFFSIELQLDSHIILENYSRTTEIEVPKLEMRKF